MNPGVSDCQIQAPNCRKVFFEDALDTTGYGWFNFGMFLLCGSVIMGMGFEIYSVSYLVPASVCELHTTNSQQGLVASVPLAGVIATSHIWGYLADTRGRRKVMVISMAMGFVAGSLAAFSPNWIVLCFFKLLSSAAVSGALALSTALLSECTPRAKRSFLQILINSIFLASVGIMAIISIPVLPLKFSYYIPVLNIQFNSWRVLCLIFALPSAISALGALFAYESPKYLLAVGRSVEALEVLKGIYAINNKKSRTSYPVDYVVLDEDSAPTATKGFFSSVVAQTVPTLKPPLLKYTILLSTLFLVTYISVNSFLFWLPFIVSVFTTSPQDGSSHLTVCEMINIYQNSTVVKENTDCSMNNFGKTVVFSINVILAVLNVMTSVLVKYISRKTIFIGIQLLSGFAAFGINSSPYWILTSVLFLIFLTGVLNTGVVTTYSVDVFPTYVRAMAVCLTLMVGRGSAFFGINILKHLLDNNCEYVFYIFGSVTCLAGVIGFLLPSDAMILERKKQLQQDI